MVREKISKIGLEKEEIYTQQHWELLAQKRKSALEVMSCLDKRKIYSIVHGSIARGDVSRNSDIDVVVTYPHPSYILEVMLEDCGLRIYEKRVVMATPSHVPKAYFSLSYDGLIQMSFPLARLRKREMEFYAFSGYLDIDGILTNKRVAGVNKRLELILPTDKGHIAKSIIGIEEEVSKILGISLDTVMERVRVLKRRDEKGRTGVYLNVLVPPQSSVEEAIMKLSHKDHNIKKILEERG